MVNTHPTKSIITSNVKGLSNVIKKKGLSGSIRKTKSDHILSTRNNL
jgi:hypothetical protein